MINILQKSQCCGCSACANACPKGCISMRLDEEGFLYPHVNTEICVNCRLCEKVCPIVNKPVSFPALEIYAAKHADTHIQLKSSSGGMFTALAEEILKKGGVVFGAAFDKNWNVVHTYAENLLDLDKLRRSKYVQSDIGKTYQQAKQFLDQGRAVLFTGTPCQIAGLRNYLGKEYENLLTAELFCHGVPSPAVWQKFLTENTQKGKISAIDFRHKHLGWDASFLKISYSDGSSLPKVPRLLRPLVRAKRGLLLRRFYRLPFWISNLYERPSCHKCSFKGWNKMADFSIGDFWGVKRNYPQLYDAKGVSVLLVNTQKAKMLLPRLSLDKTPIKAEDAAYMNRYLLISGSEHPKRADFFRRYKTENFADLKKELTTTPLWKKGMRKLLRCLNLNKKEQ